MALIITDLHAAVKEKPILKGVNLNILPNKIQVLMGANGSGKTSLSLTLMGHPDYLVTKGEIILDKIRFNNLTPDERSQNGLFLSFQKPIAISGVCYLNFLRNIYQKSQKIQNNILSVRDFLELLKKQAKLLRIKEDLVKRAVNEGLSGGEQKKMEILTMTLLKPKYAVLDEIDTGLDVDALKIVANSLGQLKETTGLLLITHYQRILKYLKPDLVHIMHEGKIVESGDFQLAERIEKEGYQRYER